MTTLALCALVSVSTLLGFADKGDTLLEKYRATCISVSNQRGLAPGDIDAIKNLRDELNEWSIDHDDFKLVAAELQLSLWLEDTDQCGILFERLTTLQPENSILALAWADYKLTNFDADPGEIYEDLIELFPHSRQVVLGWVKYLDSINRFTEAIKALEKLDFDVLALPDTSIMYANLLFADNRFDEAVSQLESIDQSLLESNIVLATNVNSKLESYSDAALRWKDETILREVEESADDLPRVLIITTKGPILVELFEDHAPNTVANFVSLAESGYYDGTRFHRVLPKFMVQGGDPNSREGAEGQPGQGGPGYTIKDEHTGDDSREHFAGSLSMAKTATPNTAGSQFFLTHLPTPHLDGKHTVFGRIVTGLEIVRSIQTNDDIVAMTVIRKRDHEYTPVRIGAVIDIDPLRSKPTLSSQSKDE